MNAKNTQNTIFTRFYPSNWPLAHVLIQQFAIILVVCLSLIICSTSPARAGPGHDHGDAPAAAAGSASPRVSAHSDVFKLVGVVDKGQMTIYLDRYATNEPVTDAKIEVETGSVKGVAAAQLAFITLITHRDTGGRFRKAEESLRMREGF